MISAITFTPQAEPIFVHPPTIAVWRRMRTGETCVHEALYVAQRERPGASYRTWTCYSRFPLSRGSGVPIIGQSRRRRHRCGRSRPRCPPAHRHRHRPVPIPASLIETCERRRRLRPPRSPIRSPGRSRTASPPVRRRAVWRVGSVRGADCGVSGPCCDRRSAPADARTDAQEPSQRPGAALDRQQRVRVEGR